MKSIRVFKKVLFLLVIIIGSSHFQIFSQNQPKTVILRGGTPVTLALRDDFSTKGKDNLVGTSLDFYVVYDVVAEGEVVIPAGTMVRSEITSFTKRKIFGVPARLTLKLDKVQTVDNKIMMLGGNNVLTSTGAVNAWAGTLTTVASSCAIVGLFIYAPMTFIAVPLLIPPFFIKGGHATIAGGSQYEVRIINNEKIQVSQPGM